MVTNEKKITLITEAKKTFLIFSLLLLPYWVSRTKTRKLNSKLQLPLHRGRQKNNVERKRKNCGLHTNFMIFEIEFSLVAFLKIKFIHFLYLGVDCQCRKFSSNRSTRMQTSILNASCISFTMMKLFEERKTFYSTQKDSIYFLLPGFLAC